MSPQQGGVIIALIVAFGLFLHSLRMVKEYERAVVFRRP